MSNEKSKPTNAKRTHNYQDQLIKNEHTHTQIPKNTKTTHRTFQKKKNTINLMKL